MVVEKAEGPRPRSEGTPAEAVADEPGGEDRSRSRPGKRSSEKAGRDFEIRVNAKVGQIGLVDSNDDSSG